MCAFQYVASKQVLGWHVAATMPEKLVTTALQRVLLAQPFIPELIVHSDWGGQYCGNTYQALLHQHGAVRSQSRRGDCYDNALLGTIQSEILWSRFKTEELERREWAVFANLANAQASAASYFDHYNQRLHSNIGYQFPYIVHQ